MNQLIVALHGNPGNITDFYSVIEELGIDGKADAIIHHRPLAGMNIHKLVVDIEENIASFKKREITVIAYSWGCYLACRWLAISKLNISKIIFISPTLIAENPVSPLAVIITKIPILGNLILNRIAKTKSIEFIEKCFYPQIPSPQNQALLYNQLNSPVIWKGAINYKHQQQKIGIAGLKKFDDIKVIVVRGELDSSVNRLVQENALRTLSLDWGKVRMHEIKNAGHALLWTHAKQIAQRLLTRRTNDFNSMSRK